MKKATKKAGGKGTGVKHVTAVEGEDELLVAKKTEAPSLKIQVLLQLADKSKDLIDERRKIGYDLDRQIAKRTKIVDEVSQKESENCGRTFATKRGSFANAKKDARNELQEATRALAITQVTSENRKKVQELKQKRKAAQEAANAAKETFQLQKDKEKEAFEATSYRSPRVFSMPSSSEWSGSSSASELSPHAASGEPVA